MSDDQAAQTTPWDAAIASAAQPDTAFRQVGRSLAEQIAANGPEATASVDVHGVAVFCFERLLADAPTLDPALAAPWPSSRPQRH